MFSAYQQTIAKAVHCSSVGLHTGATVTLHLEPASVFSGIRFKRMDIDGGRSERSTVEASYDLVTDTMLGTTIENEHGVGVATVEHLMAALWGMGIDNVLVRVDGPEVPIMDGSSADFIRLIEQAGVIAQDAPRRMIVIDEMIEVTDGQSVAILKPYDGFRLDIDIEFKHDAIARQSASYDFADVTFKEAISEARTCGFAADVAKLQAAGLARGGSLDNAIVIDDDGVMNDGGLRFDDEFVRHKALDCMGDYFLAGMRLWGHAVTSKPGHCINNKLIRALFNKPSAWHIADGTDLGFGTPAVAAYGSRAGRRVVPEVLMTPAKD